MSHRETQALTKSVCEECLRPKNTHFRGKDHCTVGLQFNKIGCDQKRKYVVITMYLVKQLSLNL